MHVRVVERQKVPGKTGHRQGVLYVCAAADMQHTFIPIKSCGLTTRERITGDLSVCTQGGEVLDHLATLSVMATKDNGGRVNVGPSAANSISSKDSLTTAFLSSNVFSAFASS